MINGERSVRQSGIGSFPERSRKKKRARGDQSSPRALKRRRTLWLSVDPDERLMAAPETAPYHGVEVVIKSTARDTDETIRPQTPDESAIFD